MEKRKNYAVWALPALIVWLFINIRVEAGAATVLERALDGLVAGGLLLLCLYYGARFFNLINLSEKEKDN